MIKKCTAAGAAGFITSYMLYKNIVVSVVVMIVFILGNFLNKRGIERDRKSRMRRSFLDFLMCLEPLLKNSGTFYKAFQDAAKDYSRFHGRDELSTYIDSAVNDFRMNNSTAEVLRNLAEKMEIEDARAFAGSMAVCELTGGNPVEITVKTTELLVGKIRILCELNTTLSGKVFEQKIITMMPFALLGVFSVVSEVYLKPLYITATGKIVMTAAGIIFLIQWYIGKRITDIEV